MANPAALEIIADLAEQLGDQVDSFGCRAPGPGTASGPGTCWLPIDGLIETLDPKTMCNLCAASWHLEMAALRLRR